MPIVRRLLCKLGLVLDSNLWGAFFGTLFRAGVILNCHILNLTPMITIRKSNDRGLANFGWLFSRHTFSFGQYQNPNYRGFGNLIVINEDKIQASKGFGTHSHQDMEIITYVISSALAHKDSLGNGSVIRPGDIQRMSAGTGISHSEFNASDHELAHILQIWLLPGEQGIDPSYEQKFFSEAEKTGKLLLVGSQTGREGSITIHQDVDLFASIIDKGQELNYTIKPDRILWLQVVKGSLSLNHNYDLTEGDGVAITLEPSLNFQTQERSEFLLFDMG